MNLLRLFEFYLMAMFVIGTVRRMEFYHAIVRLALRLVRRYQRLFGVVKERSGQLLTWSIIVPAAVTLVLWAIQSLLTRVVFPDAQLTTETLSRRWWFWPTALAPTLAVIALDAYFLFRVGQVDAAETERYFRQAESWIGTWKARAVQAASLGYINPQQIVHVEVEKALDAGSRLIRGTLWWTVLQTALRVWLGLSLWLLSTAGPLA